MHMANQKNIVFIEKCVIIYLLIFFYLMTNISCKKQPRLPIVEVAFYFVNDNKYFDLL
jgi:hypothetical protein